ncbi:polyprenol monophosphomannose synthase [Candidatus Woesearchaeota archaeon]|nr:polyprenol monophosphomannose synthase [Candidatus Woesearchaeota archaeon]
MKVCIILPTYNERANIAPLFDQLMTEFSVLERLFSVQMHLVVVDDNSPDGTADAVKAYKGRYPQAIDLLTGQKQGLGMAYIRGFHYALQQGYDVVFEMDADLSHDPSNLRNFLQAIQEGADFVIGSRYIHGGSINDWSIFRKAISTGGNFFARIVAGMYTVHDCTSGYRAIRADLLQRIHVDTLHAKGYAFQMDLLAAALQANAKIVEIPIVFADRTHGKSKLGAKDFTEFIRNAFILRLKKFKV